VTPSAVRPWQFWLLTYSGFIPREDLRTYLDTHDTLQALRALYGNELISGNSQGINQHLKPFCPGTGLQKPFPGIVFI